jgi:glycosyltransferase involved in cell wall biosynthesis
MTGPDNRRPRLVVVSQDQFGYLTDTQQYCKYLRAEFEITYVGWDYGLPPLFLEGVTVFNVPRRGGKIRRMAAYLRAALHVVRQGDFDLVLVEQFPFCSLVPLFGGHRSRTILDIRTGYVRDSVPMRILVNRMIWLESLAFPLVMIISGSLRRFLGIPAAISQVLPLGAESLDIPPKTFTGLRLFYVGSLDYRHIDETVRGLDLFLKRRQEPVEATYDIVGFGSPESEDRLRQAINTSCCPGQITFHGRIPNGALRPFLERNTVGVAFIPLKKHYDCQPATKVFEYLLAGMAVIATRTLENARVVNDNNGVLTADNAEAFCGGLEDLWMRLGTFDSSHIRAESAGYAWDRIVGDILRPALFRVLARERGVASQAPTV